MPQKGQVAITIKKEVYEEVRSFIYAHLTPPNDLFDRPSVAKFTELALREKIQRMKEGVK